MVKIKIVYANIIKVLENDSKIQFWRIFCHFCRKITNKFARASALRVLAPSVSVVPNKSVLIGNFWKSKQGRPPRDSEKGAVRCGWASVESETTSTFFRSIKDLLQRHFWLLFDPSIEDLLLRHFWLLLDPSIEDLLLRHFWLLLDPSIENLLLRHFWLLLDLSIENLLLRHFWLLLDPSIYVVTLSEIGQGGDLPQSREWFRSLRSLNHKKGLELLMHILHFTCFKFSRFTSLRIFFFLFCMKLNFAQMYLKVFW